MRQKKKNIKPIDSPIYNYWQAFYFSFYNKNVYKDVAKHWHGAGIKYLLFAIALTIFPGSMKATIDFNRYFSKEVVKPLRSLPLIYVQNSKASIDEKEPYIIKNSNGDITTVIDTRIDPKKLGTLYPNANIIIAKDKLYIKATQIHWFIKTAQYAPDSSFVQYEFPPNVNEVFSGSEMVNNYHLDIINVMISILIYPICAFLVFGFFIVFLLIAGSLGQVYSSTIYNVKLTYKQSCRILAVALTPHLFMILFVYRFYTHTIPYINLLFLLLIILYYTFAIVTLKYSKKELVR